MTLLRMVVFDTVILLLVLGAAAAQAPDEGYSREQLQPLTKFRLARRSAPRAPLANAAFQFCF